MGGVQNRAQKKVKKGATTKSNKYIIIISSPRETNRAGTTIETLGVANTFENDDPDYYMDFFGRKLQKII